MGSGMPDDRKNTIEQLKNPLKDHGKHTWLRHRLSAQSGKIDMMLLGGVYTVDEMAAKLKETYPDRSIEILIKRVKDHIEHLQHGDARDDSTIHRDDRHVPHNLKLNEKNDRWFFDKNQ